jgi:hypothetical protein
VRGLMGMQTMLDAMSRTILEEFKMRGMNREYFSPKRFSELCASHHIW